MGNLINRYYAVISGFTALLTAIFGVYWYIFTAYLVLNILNWLTGWYKARKLGVESSLIGFRGIAKKLGYWVMITVAFLMAYVMERMGADILKVDLSILNMVGWFTLACLIVNEIRSILENLVQAGYKVPEVLVKGLAVVAQVLTKDANNEGRR